MRTSRRFDVALILVLVIAVIFAYVYRQLLHDQLVLILYRPPQAVADLATEAGMNSEGRRYFYLSQPQITDAATITTNCSAGTLGCINAKGQIFILKAGDGESAADEIVTAAHEMLHQAYRHLDDQSQRRVDELTSAAVVSLADDDLNQKLSVYTDAAELADEEHSILGSEAVALPANLENYYTTYFSDRSKTTRAATTAQGQPN